MVYVVAAFAVVLCVAFLKVRASLLALPQHVYSGRDLYVQDVFAENGTVRLLSCGKCKSEFTRNIVFSEKANIWKVCPHCKALRTIAMG